MFSRSKTLGRMAENASTLAAVSMVGCVSSMTSAHQLQAKLVSKLGTCYIVRRLHAISNMINLNIQRAPAFHHSLLLVHAI